jgi:hypothetical protein
VLHVCPIPVSLPVGLRANDLRTLAGHP